MAPTHRPRPWKARIASVSRWLHVYLSMLGLFVLLFFSATGITLNHPTWFLASTEHTRQADGSLEPAWVALPTSPLPDDADPASAVSRLEVVEHLRAAHNLRGALTSFTADDLECSVTFKGPGYSADAFIDRETGAYTITEISHGLVAVLNDLHKGRDTGPVWAVLIDVSALVMVAASLSGLVLIFYIKRRRNPGLVVAFLGTAAVLALIFFFVP